MINKHLGCLAIRIDIQLLTLKKRAIRQSINNQVFRQHLCLFKKFSTAHEYPTLFRYLKKTIKFAG